ncbi:hypothetical protein PBT90_20085 [Algoriphagus halophytocola]|uniref:sensor histidine kinase n=1 Tax=Algoriphagus halophytocola TaxID=2991499 RepID=UPI0022DE8A6E|nr:hypothetical protein [Algoriphagus sp. TR-M9]WBL43028.1 hypothetical protein PBT90_20085 [Algoriphagus sp. TR-M9]
MKSIIRQFLNKESVVNKGEFNVDSLIFIVNKYSIGVVWLLWTIYLGVDILTRIYSNVDFASVKIIALHYFTGGFFQQFVFFVFLPNVLYLKKWKKLTVLLIFFFIAYLFLKLFILGTPLSEAIVTKGFIVKEGMRIFQFQIYIVALWGMVVAIKTSSEKNRLQLDYDRIRIDHTSIQLNPHMVINLFSGFAASIYPLSRDLYEDFNNFSALLSYCYKDPRFPNFLNEEVQAMEYLISCQKSRFPGKLSFNLTHQLDLVQCSRLVIPKGALMSFVENAFKHGRCFDPNTPCILNMRLVMLENGCQRFSFAIDNAKDISAPKQSSQFGIKAVNRILAHHFIDHYQLFISETHTDFSVFLYIDYEGNFTNWSA